MCFKLNELRCFVFIIIINLDFISLILVSDTVLKWCFNQLEF